MFEPSRADGNGKRIPLGFVQHLQFPDHQATPSWRASRAGIGLFPGAIVAFRGKRKDGLEGPFFEVKELLPVRDSPYRTLSHLILSLSFLP